MGTPAAAGRCSVMVLQGSCKYLWTGFLSIVFVFCVAASPLRNDTKATLATSIDRVWNESSYPTQIGTSRSSAGLWRQICKHGNHLWLWSFRNASNLTLEGITKQKKKSVSATHLCCLKDKGSQNGMLVPDCDIFAALCKVGLAVSRCHQTSCRSDKVRSQNSANESFKTVFINFNLTKDECRGRLVTINNARQSKRVHQAQLIIKRGVCVIKTKQMEKSDMKCCYDIADLCINSFSTSHRNETILKSTQSDLEAQQDYDRSREVEDYINQSIISLVVCVLMVIGVFLTVMTYNLWSSRKRYQDSLKSQSIEQT